MGQDVPRQRWCRPPRPVFPIGTRVRDVRLWLRDHAVRRRRSRPGRVRAGVPDRGRPRPGARVPPPGAHRLLLPHARARAPRPRTPCRRRWSGPGGRSTASRAARRCGRGCTASPTTCASTCTAARSAGPGRWRWARPRPGRGRCLGPAARAHLRPADRRRAGDRPRRRPGRGRRRPRVDPAGLRRRPPAPAGPAALGAHPVRGAALAGDRGRPSCSTPAWPRSTAPCSGPGPRWRRSQGEQLDPTVDPEHQALLARYVDAFERYDIPALVALLRDDVVLSMPPFDLWLRGRRRPRRLVSGRGHRLQGRPAAARRRQRHRRVRQLPHRSGPACGSRGPSR